MEHYILKYLYDTTSDMSMKRLIDYCKFQLDNRIWSAGRHIPYSYDTQRDLEDIRSRSSKSMRSKCRTAIQRLKSLFFLPQEKVLYESFPLKRQTNHPYVVWSLVNIPAASRMQLENEGIEYYNTNTDSVCLTGYVTPALVKIHKWYHSYICNAHFNEIIQPRNAEFLDQLYHQFVNELRALPIDAVLIKTSEMFFEKLMIDAFREIGKPSITLLHGLPGVYTLATESRADFLLVWGEKIRENFIKVGYDSKRVVVAGNYKYEVVPKHDILRTSTEDVLVLTSAPFAEHQHEWEWNKFGIQDRGLLITYLYSIENVLKKCGVWHARLRPHPAVNKEWLTEYLDMNFYQVDNMDFIESLTQATLCIGQVSSTLLEALMSGVSYIPYEPSENGKEGMGHTTIVSPFDGSEKTLQTAYSEEQLYNMIMQKYSPNTFDMESWMKGFDVRVITSILEARNTNEA